MNHPLKYEKDISDLEDCPPMECVQARRVAFRFVHDNMKHPYNFLPACKIKPSRTFRGPALCASHGLSFFDTLDNAVRKYDALAQSHPLIYKTLGKNVARGNLKKLDGLMTSVASSGHFTLHEFVGTDFTKRFRIVKSLV